MCGIAGTIGVREADGSDHLLAMQHSLRFRGPDEKGIWRGENVGLVHTRLSIIDLDGSKQPMLSEDGALAVTFNGEIYNYKQLRRELRGRGHVFKTKGDTEVLLHLYRECGRSLVEHLDGMFAFAVYDARAHSLLLARDRIGIKFLSYWTNPATGQMVFATDLPALLANRAIPRILSHSALAQYLHFGYVIPPGSWIEGVRQVEPGQIVEWRGGHVTTRHYYKWGYEPNQQLADRGRAIDELRNCLGQSVRNHLVADVPVGTFLSGGLDSSTVTGLAQQIRGSSEPINSFTVRFWREEFDEARRARAIASDLGTDHSEIDAQEVPFSREFLERYIQAIGEPFGDTSSLACLALCGRARQFVKVALSGDGGDELFLGYGGLLKQRWARRLRVAPWAVRNLCVQAINGSNGDVQRRVKKYAGLSLLDDAALIIEWTRRWEWNQLAALTDADVLSSMFPDRHRLFPEVRHAMGEGATGGFLEQQIRFHMLIDLPSDCLFKIDRTSMAHGLEVRVPMLGNGMLDYAARLPLSARSHLCRTKEPLRTLAEGLSPTNALSAPKRGFRFPLDEWLRPSLSQSWRDWQVSRSLSELGFHTAALDRMVAQYDQLPTHERGYQAGSLSTQLFDLLQLGVWAQNYSITN